MSRDLADEIVRRSMKIIFHNVNVILPNGVIFSSGDARRIGTIHELGREAALLGKRINVFPEDADLFKGVAPGINQPIMVDGKVQLVVGVTGNPNEIARYAELAFLTAELLIEQGLKNEKLKYKTCIIDLELSSLLHNPEKIKTIEESQNQDLTTQFNLPKFLYFVVVEKKNNYRQALQDLLKELTIIQERSSLSVISPNSFLILNDQISAFGSQLKEMREIVKKYDVAIKIGKLENISAGVSTFKLLASISCYALNILEDESFLYTGDRCKILSIDDPHLLSSCIFSKLPNLEYLSCLKNILCGQAQGDKLIETVKTYIQCNLEITRTANHLDIHRNTIQNRFHQIKRITGLDPLVFNELVSLSYALK